MHAAKDVANYFLASVDEEAGDSLSNLKLRKLCYYAQGFQLALRGTPLFTESIEAWQHGPVIPALYGEFKQYGSAPIPRDYNFDPSCFSDIERELLDDVYSTYGQFTASRLRNMTHSEKPWVDAYANGPRTEISNQSMRDFFSTQLV